MGNRDGRFRSGECPQVPDPAPLLKRYVPELPAGRALDVATGTGRNTFYLASDSYCGPALDADAVRRLYRATSPPGTVGR